MKNADDTHIKYINNEHIARLPIVDCRHGDAWCIVNNISCLRLLFFFIRQARVHISCNSFYHFFRNHFQMILFYSITNEYMRNWFRIAACKYENSGCHSKMSKNYVRHNKKKCRRSAQNVSYDELFDLWLPNEYQNERMRTRASIHISIDII